MLKKSSLASLRRQRTTCPCNWCARNLGFLGKSGKHDPGTAAKAKNDSKSIRENILRGRRLHTEIVNSSEPESISKRSGSPDSDSSDGWFESNNSRLLEELKKTAESRPQAEQEDSTGWRHVELFKAKRIEDISSTSSIASSSCKESEGSEEVDFIEYLEKLRRRKYREECEPLEEIENCDINENVSKLEDDSESEVSDDGGWSKRRSTASDSEYTADLEQLVTMDDSCDQEDEELRDIFLGEHRVRSPEACDARTVSQKRAILCKEMNCVFCADSNERAPEEELPDNPSDFLCRERVARLQEEFWPYGSRMGEFSPETTDLDDSSDTEMPSEKESKMNLSALKQVDPEINEIVDSAAQVALYQYSTQTGQWAKTEVEGALYVYAHRNAHQRGLIILNRNSPKNYKEPIRADIEFKIKTPFLIYKTTAGHIFGAWFYVEEECTRVGNLCCRLVSYLKKRGKNETGSQPDNNNQQQGISVLQNLLPPSALPKVDAQSGANIMSLLKKAEGGSAQVTNGSSNGGNHHHNGNNGQHHQNGKSKKQPLTPNNSNHNESGGRQQENGRHRKATGDSTPGVPVVHKPVPTKSLPSSVEQLFKSAANSQHQHKKQQQQQKQQQQPQQGSSSSSSSTTAKQLYKPMPESTTSKTPRGAVNGGGGVGGGGGGDLERLLGDLTRSSLESPPPSVALVETKVEALTPLNPCMASILSKLNESAQKVQREAEMARNSPTTEEALLRAFKGPLHNNGIEKKLTLITPEMLEESLSQGPSTPPQTLSRYELKSALLHLLDTDDEFLTKIHNAYVQGVSRRKL